MCLHKIVSRPVPSEEPTRAFGVFEIDFVRGGLRSSCMAVPIPLDKWIQANEQGIILTGRVGKDQTYKPGFHKYARLDDAKDSWMAEPDSLVLPVLLRGIHTIGTESGAEVYVASEMYVASKDAEEAAGSESARAAIRAGGLEYVPL